MTLYRHELAERAFLDLTAAATDAEIIAATSTYLLTRAPGPYRLTINHDPRKAPCPLFTDWRRKDQCGAMLETAWEARDWILAAMAGGYRVWRAQGIGDPNAYGKGSLTEIRERLTSREAWAAKRADAIKNGLPDPDDDIPF